MKHAFVSQKTEVSDPTIVGSGEWNAAHIEPTSTKTGDYTFADGDGGSFYIWNDASDRVLNLPSSLTTAGWTVTIKNVSSTNKLTLTPTTVKVDGQTTLVIPSLTIAKVIYDGTNYKTGLTASAAVLPANYVMASDPSAANGMLRPRLMVAGDIPLNVLIPAAGGALPLIKSLKVGAVINQALASGDNLLYTVPSGKRAMFGGTVTNFSGGAITVNEYVRISGTDYHMGASGPATSFANSSTTAITVGNTYPVMEAGDVVNFNVSGAGLHGFFFAMVFDATEGLKSPRLLTLASGDNTVYTCPSGKIAFLMNNALGNAPIRMINKSGGSRTITWNVVPFGGSPATANKLSLAATVTNNTVNNQALASVALAAGDFISINSDSSASGQVAYVLELIEIAA